MKHPTREGWLTAAVDLLREHFRSLKLVVPAKVRASCGWPSIRKALGECWPAGRSKDRWYEIFISPILAEPMPVEDNEGILEVLVHELLHTVVGPYYEHGDQFQRAHRLIGLMGKVPTSRAGIALAVVLQEIADDLGPYPHDALNPQKETRKKSECRQLKVQCPGCGYIARVTRVWLDDAGPPICPACVLAFKETK